MRYFIVFLLGLFTVLIQVQASVVVDIFKAEVVLDKEKSDAEERARMEGFKQVIIKASGDTNAVENPVIKKAQSKSRSYLSQMGYGTQEGKQTLQMAFNPSQIQLLLNQADLPYWPDVRSVLTVWVIQEDHQGREILWEYSNNASIHYIKKFSALRGLPITIPVGDIEDVTGVTETDLWGGFISPVSVASQRYSSDAVLIIRNQQTADTNAVRWILYDEKPQSMVSSKRRPITGSIDGKIDIALKTVIDEVSNYYAKQNATKISGKSDSATVIQLTRVKSAKDFFELEQLLKKLHSVAGVYVEQVMGDTITYHIELFGSKLEFEAEMVKNRNIKKLDRVEGRNELSQKNAQEDSLVFEWASLMSF